MEPNSDLVVFRKKEILVIIFLFILVALFSFTLGLKMGKTLGGSKSEHSEEAPLESKPHEQAHSNSDHGAPEESHNEQANNHENHEPSGTHAKSDHSADPIDEAGNDPSETDELHSEHAESAKADTGKAQDIADMEMAKASEKSQSKVKATVALSLPQQKKVETEGVRFTLQVGSHRTVAEAAEQVSTLKKGELDAFYLEAKVPGKGTWYRVGIGLFETKELAEHAALKWKQAHKALPPYIIQKVNE